MQHHYRKNIWNKVNNQKNKIKTVNSKKRFVLCLVVWHWHVIWTKQIKKFLVLLKSSNKEGSLSIQSTFYVLDSTTVINLAMQSKDWSHLAATSIIVCIVLSRQQNDNINHDHFNGWPLSEIGLLCFNYCSIIIWHFSKLITFSSFQPSYPSCLF
jgi:hypothetical protein